MAIGNDPNMQQINSEAAQIAGQFRSNALQAQELQAYVVGLGQAGLVALGFASGDATLLLTCCSYMATLAGVYQGTVTQGSLFNFQNALVALTGPN
jgi:hypothetical protein